MESTSGFSKTTRNFVIPKKRTAVGTAVEPCSTESREYSTILSALNNSRLDLDNEFNSSWLCHNVMVVHNEQLLKEFLEKRSEMRLMGRLGMEEKFCFYVASDESVKDICHLGLHADSREKSTLANPLHGVHLHRHVDVALRITDNRNIIIFKVIFGKVKRVLPNLEKKCFEDPTKHYDCFVSKICAGSKDTLFKQAIGSSVFFFDYNENEELNTRPRQCLPYALVSVNRLAKTVTSAGSAVEKPLRTCTVANIRNKTGNATAKSKSLGTRNSYVLPGFSSVLETTTFLHGNQTNVDETTKYHVHEHNLKEPSDHNLAQYSHFSYQSSSSYQAPGSTTNISSTFFSSKVMKDPRLYRREISSLPRKIGGDKESSELSGPSTCDYIKKCCGHFQGNQISWTCTNDCTKDVSQSGYPPNNQNTNNISLGMLDMKCSTDAETTHEEMTKELLMDISFNEKSLSLKHDGFDYIHLLMTDNYLLTQEDNRTEQEICNSDNIFAPDIPSSEKQNQQGTQASSVSTTLCGDSKTNKVETNKCNKAAGGDRPIVMEKRTQNGNTEDTLVSMTKIKDVSWNEELTDNTQQPDTYSESQGFETRKQDNSLKPLNLMTTVPQLFTRSDVTSSDSPVVDLQEHHQKFSTSVHKMGVSQDLHKTVLVQREKKEQNNQCYEYKKYEGGQGKTSYFLQEKENAHNVGCFKKAQEKNQLGVVDYQCRETKLNSPQSTDKDDQFSDTLLRVLYKRIQFNDLFPKTNPKDQFSEKTYFSQNCLETSQDDQSQLSSLQNRSYRNKIYSLKVTIHGDMMPTSVSEPKVLFKKLNFPQCTKENVTRDKVSGRYINNEKKNEQNNGYLHKHITEDNLTTVPAVQKDVHTILSYNANLVKKMAQKYKVRYQLKKNKTKLNLKAKYMPFVKKAKLKSANFGNFNFHRVLCKLPNLKPHLKRRQSLHRSETDMNRRNKEGGQRIMTPSISQFCGISHMDNITKSTHVVKCDAKITVQNSKRGNTCTVSKQNPQMHVDKPKKLWAILYQNSEDSQTITAENYTTANKISETVQKNLFDECTDSSPIKKQHATSVKEYFHDDEMDQNIAFLKMSSGNIYKNNCTQEKNPQNSGVLTEEFNNPFIEVCKFVSLKNMPMCSHNTVIHQDTAYGELSYGQHVQSNCKRLSNLHRCTNNIEANDTIVKKQNENMFNTQTSGYVSSEINRKSNHTSTCSSLLYLTKQSKNEPLQKTSSQKAQINGKQNELQDEHLHLKRISLNADTSISTPGPTESNKDSLFQELAVCNLKFMTKLTGCSKTDGEEKDVIGGTQKEKLISTTETCVTPNTMIIEPPIELSICDGLTSTHTKGGLIEVSRSMAHKNETSQDRHNQTRTLFSPNGASTVISDITDVRKITTTQMKEGHYAVLPGSDTNMDKHHTGHHIERSHTQAIPSEFSNNISANHSSDSQCFLNTTSLQRKYNANDISNMLKEADSISSTDELRLLLTKSEDMMQYFISVFEKDQDVIFHEAAVTRDLIVAQYLDHPPKPIILKCEALKSFFEVQMMTEAVNFLENKHRFLKGEPTFRSLLWFDVTLEDELCNIRMEYPNQKYSSFIDDVPYEKCRGLKKYYNHLSALLEAHEKSQDHSYYIFLKNRRETMEADVAVENGFEGFFLSTPLSCSVNFGDTLESMEELQTQVMLFTDSHFNYTQTLDVALAEHLSILSGLLHEKINYVRNCTVKDSRISWFGLEHLLCDASKIYCKRLKEKPTTQPQALDTDAQKHASGMMSKQKKRVRNCEDPSLGLNCPKKKIRRDQQIQRANWEPSESSVKMDGTHDYQHTEGPVTATWTELHCDNPRSNVNLPSAVIPKKHQNSALKPEMTQVYKPIALHPWTGLNNISVPPHGFPKDWWDTGVFVNTSQAPTLQYPVRSPTLPSLYPLYPLSGMTNSGFFQNTPRFSNNNML